MNAPDGRTQAADALRREPKRRLLARVGSWSPVALVVAIGLSVTAIAFVTANRAEERRVVKKLEFRAEWRANDLQAKIVLARKVHWATAAYVASRPQLDAGRFLRFTSLAGAGGGSITSIGWAEPVTREQRAKFEAQSGFPILDNGPDGTRITAADRDDYTPMVIQNRFDDRPPSLGFDLSMEPSRRRAMELARDTGSPKTVITPEDSSAANPINVSFWPIFDTEAALATPIERRVHLRGYVVGAFKVVDTLNGAIADTPEIPETINFYISNETGEAATDSTFRFVATYSLDDHKVRAAQAQAPTVGTEYSFTRSFDFRGQQWRVESLFSSDAVAAERSMGPHTILAAGSLLTLVLAACVFGGTRRASVVRTLVDQQTAELTQTNTKLEALIDASPFSIVCLDAEQRVILWNAAAERLFGYAEAEVIGHPYPLVLPEERDEFDKRFRRLAAGEVLRNLPSHRRHRNGTAIDTSSSAAAFYDTAGVLLGIIFAIEDTRERTQVQNQLRQAQKMEAIGQLTGGLAHDFNNLIGIVLGNLDLLAERFETGSDTRKLTDGAIQAALRGAQLTRQLLAFSRRQPLAPKLTHLPPVLEGMAQLLRRTLGEAITLELKASDTLWPILIDVAQLESALLNLSVNARDAMPKGGRLTIEASNVVIDERAFELNLEAIPGDYVLIAVSDTGVGMSAEVMAQVFEPFFTTKGAGGTGLGLSMVHGFLKQSGGYTRVYSELGHGTTVRLYLPRGPQGEVAGIETLPAEILARGDEVILVVEDNKGLRDLAVLHLQSLGYHTISAADGAAALEIIQGGAPVDLLFTDMVMPGGMDGRALAAAAQRQQPELKILFTSGFTAAAASAATDDKFGSNLLSKPYRKGELAHRIRVALDAAD